MKCGRRAAMQAVDGCQAASTPAARSGRCRESEPDPIGHEYFKRSRTSESPLPHSGPWTNTFASLDARLALWVPPCPSSPAPHTRIVARMSTRNCDGLAPAGCDDGKLWRPTRETVGVWSSPGHATCPMTSVGETQAKLYATPEGVSASARRAPMFSRVSRLAVFAALALAACGPNKSPPGASLDWAYPDAAPRPFPIPASGVQHVPGSALTLTAAQVGDFRNPPDWFPGEHPPAPAVVAHGSRH